MATASAVTTQYWAAFTRKGGLTLSPSFSVHGGRKIDLSNTLSVQQSSKTRGPLLILAMAPKKKDREYSCASATKNMAMVSGEETGTASTRFLLLLTLSAIMLEVGAVRAAAIEGNVAELQVQRWREKLPEVGIPEAIAGRLSPHTQAELQNFGAPVRANKSLNATQFCRSADLSCDEAHDELAETMPPFSAGNLTQLLTLLGIPRGSNVSRNMLSTLEACEGRLEEGESRTCCTSVECMVDYVDSVLGSDVELLSDTSVVGSGQMATVRKVNKRENVSGKAPMACHRLVFAYGVLYCHYFSGTEAFDVELEVTQNGRSVTRNATAVCHYFSKGGAQKEALCHAIYGSTLLWLPKIKSS